MANQVISREEARAQGLARFFSGEACRRGHIAERATSHGKCVECHYENCRRWSVENPEAKREQIRRAKAKNPEGARASVRRWRIANADKVREQNSEYQKANPDVGRRAAAKWRSKNPDVVREQNRRWYAENPEKRRDLGRRKYQNNGERIRERNNAWIKANPEKKAVIDNRRRAREIEASGTHTAADLKAILTDQDHKCAYCRTDLRKAKRHVDHITPLSRGGSNDRSNVQLTCVSCNLSKGARDPIEFAQQMGRLL